MNVLVACEFTGTVRDAFAASGHYAVSCDLTPSEKPGNHYVGDVRNILDEGWDLLIAHPPCTYLCNSGIGWLKRKGRMEKMLDAVDFFNALLYAPVERICIENPIMHRYALELLCPPTQKLHPSAFGHDEAKEIWFWLRNLPELVSGAEISDVKHRLRDMSPRKDRGRERSRFFPGVAAAMARQWGNL